MRAARSQSVTKFKVPSSTPPDVSMTHRLQESNPGLKLFLYVLQQHTWCSNNQVLYPLPLHATAGNEKRLKRLQLLLLQQQHLWHLQQHAPVDVAAAEAPTLQGEDDSACLVWRACCENLS